MKANKLKPFNFHYIFHHMAMALLQLLLINYVTLLLTDEDPKYPLCFYKSVPAPAMKAFNKNPEIQEFSYSVGLVK